MKLLIMQFSQIIYSILPFDDIQQMMLKTIVK
jgi:hypothetical protein